MVVNPFHTNMISLTGSSSQQYRHCKGWFALQIADFGVYFDRNFWIKCWKVWKNAVIFGEICFLGINARKGSTQFWTFLIIRGNLQGRLSLNNPCRWSTATPHRWQWGIVGSASACVGTFCSTLDTAVWRPVGPWLRRDNGLGHGRVWGWEAGKGGGGKDETGPYLI